MKNSVQNALHNALKLSKTNYLVWRDCPHNAWIKQNRPDIYQANPPSAFEQGLFDTGNEVDELAQSLFPNGVLVERGDAQGTRALIAARTPVIYQPVFETRRFTTACDILVWHEGSRVYDIYEVKSSTKVKPTHTNDAAIQWFVLNSPTTLYIEFLIVGLFLVRKHRR